ncbi:GTP cyclohydrolase FolE2 [Alkalihalobacterium bogoriense]|uniref:GTP cyclohydrolase FolE2 n=1 Tax=Alkalihalobacterium bogoriense TaxID=246272 RepID=UPI000B05375E
MKMEQLPSKAERYKRFGSVSPILGEKPVVKEKMVDLQNIPNDFLFALDQVGVSKIKHPIIVCSDYSPIEQTSIGSFSLTTNLPKMSKGINMSRLPELLHHYYEKGLKMDFDTLYSFCHEMTLKMEQQQAHISVEFPWFYERKSPALHKVGLSHAQIGMSVHYEEGKGFSHEVELLVAITTLCPCSKEISEYSAHNQRGFVKMKTQFFDPTELKQDWKVILLEAAESNASSVLFPVLKRPDEKAVTEKAYENPRFVEDIVRLVAADLYENETIQAFTVECRNEESIHMHDAIASFSYNKNS